MIVYTDKEIQDLIEMPKKIVARPRKELKLQSGHYRNDMKLQSADGQYDFSAFMRMNAKFNENFSVGLVLQPRNEPGEIHLFRCNGRNGPHFLFEHHEVFHFHIAREENIREGLKENRDAYITKEYSTYEDALVFFLKKCNIVNASDYFDLERQLPLPFERNEGDV